VVGVCVLSKNLVKKEAKTRVGPKNNKKKKKKKG